MPDKTSRTPQDGAVYLEKPDLGGALGLAVGVDRVLERRRTRFQDLSVLEAGELGRVLVLDNCIQTTSFDEPAYHEMLAHVPLLTHPAPRRVLIIGGGDGGTLREVLKHPVEAVDLCEIDGGVIEAARQWLPGLAAAFDDPRATVHVGDGAAFAAARQAAYDVILVDSSDPEGPACVLYTPEFYADLKRALRPGGLVVSQSESFWIYPELIRHMFGFVPGIFDLALYYTTMVPTYNSGVIGFCCASLGPDPRRAPRPERVAALGPLSYYTAALHRAAFAVPQRVLELLPPAVAQAQVIL